MLGDTPIIIGTDPPTVITDDRINALEAPENRAYKARLAAGHGHDEHRRLLRALQQRQRNARNRPGGYWIAEADPDAARYAITSSMPFETGDWAVIATDGAAVHASLQDWTDIASRTSNNSPGCWRTGTSRRTPTRTAS